MGIHKLMSLIQEKAPLAIKKNEISKYSGRTVVVDASMAMYQFLVSTQSFNQSEYAMDQLTDSEGNKTGHLVGLFSRSLTLLEQGIKPIWVFDGQPPDIKMEELKRRKALKQEAGEKVVEKLEEGQVDQAAKQAQRTVGITKDMKDDAMHMLHLMGMTVIEAKCEAEAQCAVLARAGKAFGVVSDDMDTLTFRAPCLLRGFHSKKDPVLEIDYEQMLLGFQMDYPQFVDLCILCGCDYAPSVEGIGPITAYKLIKEWKSLEKVIEFLEKDNLRQDRKKKYIIPQLFKDRYQMARDMFTSPIVHSPDTLTFKKGPPIPQEESLIKFLVDSKGFNLQRVQNGIKRIKNYQCKGGQSHMEAFFGKPITIKSSSKPKALPKSKQGKK